MAAAKGKAKGKARSSKQTSRSSRAGLNFPVGRIARFLKEGRYAQRVGAGAAVYLAAVLEYLTAELLELSGNNAKLMKRSRIIPRNIFLSVKEDAELDQLLGDAVIASGGSTVFNINPFLLKKKK
jgi:histone H2A